MCPGKNNNLAITKKAKKGSTTSCPQHCIVVKGRLFKSKLSITCMMCRVIGLLIRGGLEMALVHCIPFSTCCSHDVSC